MSKIILNSILFENTINKVNDERYLEIRKRSSRKQYLFNEYKKNNYDFLEIKAYELTNSFENKDLNIVEKYLYLSNLIFPNDEKIAETLLSKDYNLNKLKNISDLLKTIKKLNKKDQSKALDNKLINELNYFSKLYFGLNNTNIIINKSNELIAKKPYLLIKK